MTKARVVKIEDYINEMTRKNSGQPTKLIGPNKFEMDLTIENLPKLKAMIKNSKETKK